ncbi:hypothetical protein BGX38DRAFT_1265091 [Terfezia claveryi]|nr:hypothetical protein BGX38DRAFT_1265091 [Terfezia claveryi]
MIKNGGLAEASCCCCTAAYYDDETGRRLRIGVTDLPTENQRTHQQDKSAEDYAGPRKRDAGERGAEERVTASRAGDEEIQQRIDRLCVKERGKDERKEAPQGGGAGL